MFLLVGVMFFLIMMYFVLSSGGGGWDFMRILFDEIWRSSSSYNSNGVGGVFLESILKGGFIVFKLENVIVKWVFCFLYVGEE